MNGDRIRAVYRVETAAPVEEAARIMAGEQSVGTFVAVPGESAELVDRYGARVERVSDVRPTEDQSLPGSHWPAPGPRVRAEVVLSFPFETIGSDLVALFTAVAGNLYELAPFSGLRLTDLQLPPAVTDAHPGPAFGIEGTRRLTGVHDRPLIGTIVKPSVGLTPDETAELVRQLCDAGLDFIKDDELQGDSPHSPFEARVAAVMRVVDDRAQRTGRRPMVAFNVSGEVDDMLRRHDVVVAHGGTCVMVNMLTVGLAGVQKLRRHSALPIHGHRAGWGALSRHPQLGMDYRALQQLFRLAGVDHLHVNGLNNKFCEDDDSVIVSARACLTPLNDRHVVMPVFSSGQTARQIPDTYRALGSHDFMFLAGGGIMGHPHGPAAGVASLRQAWDATRAGVPLQAYAADHEALRTALDRFGTP